MIGGAAAPGQTGFLRNTGATGLDSESKSKPGARLMAYGLGIWGLLIPNSLT